MPHTVNKLYAFGFIKVPLESKNYDFETLLNFGKLCKDCTDATFKSAHVFFSYRRFENLKLVQRNPTNKKTLRLTIYCFAHGKFLLLP